MMMLWEHESLNVKELGERLYLDSGTLTPLLKKLEAKGLLSRKRSKKDERCLDIQITDKGEELKAKAANIPNLLSKSVGLSKEEEEQLYTLLNRILSAVSRGRGEDTDE
jgi:DNA-binding MarR family transcriptional regulator